MQDNWFSNFIPFDEPFVHEGLIYRTPEHFFQAQKANNFLYRQKIANAPTPNDAKMLGRRAPLRPDWEEIKFSVMDFALRQKFRKDTSWGQRLTGSEGDIVEYNTWHDNIWGDCVCGRCDKIEGQNHLGKLLMKIREELREQ